MDLFYYGSQDMPLPFRGASGGPSRPGPGTCESCSAVVSAEDLESGRASELFGLILCPECKEKTRAEDRIELYFCDRCQVSVPVFRVDTGEALAGDGRILCLSCREETTGRRGLPAVLLSAFIVLALVGLALVAARRKAPPAQAPDAVVDGMIQAIDRQLDRLPDEAETSAIADRLRDMRESMDGLDEDRDAVLEKLDQSSAKLLGTRSRFDERMRRLEAETAKIRQRIVSMMDDAPADR